MKLRPVLFATSLLACVVLASGATANDEPRVRVTGTIALLEDGSNQTRREARNTVIWYEPDTSTRVRAGGTAPEPLDVDGDYQMVTVRKSFQPRVLVVPRGATVRFPNQDPILHNVFSVSGRNRFDLGLYRKDDEGAEATLEHSGVVRVFCNVHHDMVGYVAVVDTPYYGTPRADGSFQLDDLPPGPGRLTVWHERAEPLVLEVRSPGSMPSHLDLEITKPRVPRHRNKFGKPYSRRRGRAY